MRACPRVFHHLLTVMACHGAVRAHQHLHDHEIRALLHDLAGATMPFTCPHGRPVLLLILLWLTLKEVSALLR